MANEWLRLWHDMPNDPKFKTVARHSKQPVSLVLAVYIHMLVDASKNKNRGTVNLVNEDIASALDVDEEQIQAILSAMEGRLKEGNQLTGWDSRQPSQGSATDGVKATTDNYIYYVGATDNYDVKVGFSRNPWSRVKDLQAGSTRKYELLAVMKTTSSSQSEIQQFFKSSQLNGEWIVRTDALNSLIAKTKSKEIKSHDEAIDYLNSLSESAFVITTEFYGSDGSATKDKDKDKDKDKEEIKIKTKTKTKAVALPAAPLPDWLPEDAWNGYLQMRKEKKKPPTEHAIDLLWQKMLRMWDEGQDIAAVLNRSTLNGWTDVYPITESTIGTFKPGGFGFKKESIEDINKRAADNFLAGEKWE